MREEDHGGSTSAPQTNQPTAARPRLKEICGSKLLEEVINTLQQSVDESFFENQADIHETAKECLALLRKF